MKKIVLIGDIVSSRKIKNRSLTQQKFEETFKQINKKNKPLISPFTITLGDEFQAVYEKADLLFYNIWQILQYTSPIKIRFSIGVGEITTPINKKQAIGMDGPAFYFAREGMEELKETNNLFILKGEGISNSELLNQILFLLSHQINGWKQTRYKIITSLYEGISVKEMADRLGITDKAVYKNIDAGALQNIKRLTDEISRQINDVIK